MLITMKVDWSLLSNRSRNTASYNQIVSDEEWTRSMCNTNYVWLAVHKRSIWYTIYIKEVNNLQRKLWFKPFKVGQIGQETSQSQKMCFVLLKSEFKHSIARQIYSNNQVKGLIKGHSSCAVTICELYWYRVDRLFKLWRSNCIMYSIYLWQEWSGRLWVLIGHLPGGILLQWQRSL